MRCSVKVEEETIGGKEKRRREERSLVPPFLSSTWQSREGGRQTGEMQIKSNQTDQKRSKRCIERGME